MNGQQFDFPLEAKVPTVAWRIDDNLNRPTAHTTGSPY
jgi:hypothetical protein